MLPEILDAGVAAAKQVGYRNITRAMVCERLGKSETWLQFRCPFKDLVNALESRADELGLTEGDPTGGSAAKYSGNWAAANKVRILETAYSLAVANGFSSFGRNALAAAAGVSAGVVNLRWGNMAAVLDEVAREAERRGNTDLLRQAQAVGNPVAVEYFKRA